MSSSSSSSVPAPPPAFQPAPLQIATVTYAGYSFATTGRAQFSRKVKYEIDAPGAAAKRAVVTYELQHVFQEDSFADNEVRYQALRAALQVSEGLLTITDENGTVLWSQNARVQSFDYPAQWGQALAEVTVGFEAYENISDNGNSIDAVYTPAGGVPVILKNVVTWKESIKTERFGFQVDERKETNGFVLATGIIRADPALSDADRRSYLQGQAALLKTAAACKNGALTYGSFGRVVRLDGLDPDLNNGTDSLKWSISFSYRLFPSGDYAEAEYQMTQRDDLVKMETVTTIKGLIRSDNTVDAYTKAAEIAAQYATGRVKTGDSFDEHHVDGTDGADFLELNFTYEYRQTIADGHTTYVLTVATKDDAKSGQITTTYAGSVVGASSSVALSKARSLGLNQLPIILRADETVKTESIDGSGVQFIEVTFSYEYLGKGTRLYAEVTAENDRQVFGALSSTISGFVTADTYANALIAARSHKLAGVLVRSERESSPTIVENGTSQFVKVDFTYSYSLQRVDGAISYKVRTYVDYQKWETHVMYTGTAFGSTEAAADTLINSIVPAGYFPSMSKDERTSSFDTANVSVFLSREFSLDFFYTITENGPGGGDGGIQKARLSVESEYSVNKAKVTLIPYDLPNIQTHVGSTPGRIVVSGSVSALTQQACTQWARAKKSGQGQEDQNREKMETEYATKSGTTVRLYRLDFTYSRVLQQLLAS